MARLTESQLRTIIREELKNVVKEGFFDTIKKSLGLGPTEREEYEKAREQAIDALPKTRGIIADELGRAILDSITREKVINAKVREMFPNVKIPSDKSSISAGQAERTAQQTGQYQKFLTTGGFKQ
jgi:vacuolar-type H+-ATPase subunit E/Vma4